MPRRCGCELHVATVRGSASTLVLPIEGKARGITPRVSVCCWEKGHGGMANILNKYKSYVPSKSRQIRQEGIWANLPELHAVRDDPPPASQLGERRLAIALIECTYTDLQRPARTMLWDDAMDFVNAAYPSEAAIWQWVCDTINVDPEWLRRELKRTAKWPLVRTPLTKRQLRYKRRLH